MAEKTLDELIQQLFTIHNQYLDDDAQRKNLRDKQAKLLKGNEKKDRELYEKMQNGQNDLRRILEEWAIERIDRSRDPIPTYQSKPVLFESKVDTDLDIVKDAPPVEKIARFGHVNVPLGQIFVFGHEALGESGFPEIYLGGENIAPKGKDKKSLVAILAEWPGDVRCVANQWLAGISLDRENTAKISIQIPVFLRDPLQTLKRSGGAWMFSDGREKSQPRYKRTDRTPASGNPVRPHSVLVWGTARNPRPGL